MERANRLGDECPLRRRSRMFPAEAQEPPLRRVDFEVGRGERELIQLDPYINTNLEGDSPAVGVLRVEDFQLLIVEVEHDDFRAAAAMQPWCGR